MHILEVIRSSPQNCMIPMCKYLRKTVLMPLHSLSFITFMFLCLSVIGTIISFFLFPLLPVIVLVQSCLIVWLLLHIRKPRDESRVSEQRTDLREKGEDSDKRLIHSTVVKLALFMEFNQNLVNDEIDARQFRKLYSETPLGVLKIKILNEKLTMIVCGEKGQKLVEGMKFKILQTDDNEIERSLGTALISYVQKKGML